MTMTIPAGTTFKGELHSDGRLKVDGAVEGHGFIDGVLWLADGSRWKGTIIADIVVVAGTLEGEVVARSKLEIHPNARITGQMTSPSIQIIAGAQITGQLQMRLPEALPHLDDEQKDSASKGRKKSSAIPA